MSVCNHLGYYSNYAAKQDEVVRGAHSWDKGPMESQVLDVRS